MEIHKFIIKRDWSPFMENWWGNWYAILPPWHKYFWVDYDNIPVDVHWWLTFSEKITSELMEILSLPIEWGGMWMIWFDTAHYGDNLDNCNEEFVSNETDRLIEQLRI